MGKLFWKFFIIFWLAQVFTSFGVGIAIWALRPDQSHDLEHVVPCESAGKSSAITQPGRGDDQTPTPNGEMGSPPRHPRILPPLLPIVAGSVVSLIFAVLLAWYFARPIRNLRTAFDAVANGELGTRIGSAMGGRHDELSDLGHDFDRMASRLQGVMEAQQRLLHDVSHELRSPLARLQMAIDLLQQQPERATEFIARLERDTGRIDTLVGELLMLARLDSGMAGRMDETIDMHELIDNMVSDARFEAEAKQCSVDVSMPEYITVKGNQELLYRAFENVIRNAVLHSPAGKRVQVSVIQDGAGQLIITVTDEGPGVSPSELETIFVPFFRSKQEGSYLGYGLGLAITQRIIQAHGGMVRAVNRTNGGLAVTITLKTL